MQGLNKRQLSRLAAVMLLAGSAAPGRAWAQSSQPEKPEPVHGRTIEDWSALGLAGSQLKSVTPLMGEKDDEPSFTRELIQVQWRNGDPIDLYIIKPKFVPKPRVVLYLYSYPSDTSRFRDNDYCTRITSGGVAAVGFVSALTGHRYKMRPMKEWFVSELQESLGTSVHDVQMVLNFLASRDDLDSGNAGIFGTGSGGTIAILAAATDPRIKAVDALNPWGDWPEWMASSSIIPENERPNFITPEFLKKIAGLDPVQCLPQLKTAHVRIQEIADDTVTPKVARARIEAAAPAGAKIVRYQNTREFYAAASAGRLFQWVKEQVRQSPEAAAENTRNLQPAAQDASKTNTTR